MPGIKALIVIIYKVSESRLLFVESDPGCLDRLKIRLLCSQDYLPGEHLSRDKEIFSLAVMPHFKEEIKAELKI